MASNQPRKAGSGACDEGAVSSRAADSDWSLGRTLLRMGIRALQYETLEEER
jgi:hypothetical protein